MAFTVEDGSGLESANAYATLEFVNDYHSDRGTAAWTGTDDFRQSAIIRATEYIEAAYRWQTGAKTNPRQRLGWPREDAEDREGAPIANDVVPLVVQEATAELAVRALTEDLLPSFDRITSSETIGPLSVSYFDNKTLPRFPIVDGKLYGLAELMIDDSDKDVVRFTDVWRT